MNLTDLGYGVALTGSVGTDPAILALLVDHQASRGAAACVLHPQVDPARYERAATAAALAGRLNGPGHAPWRASARLAPEHPRTGAREHQRGVLVVGARDQPLPHELIDPRPHVVLARAREGGVAGEPVVLQHADALGGAPRAHVRHV